jgi:hypothetical protein
MDAGSIGKQLCRIGVMRMSQTNSTVLLVFVVVVLVAAVKYCPPVIGG